jgi:hypothetical protein
MQNAKGIEPYTYALTLTHNPRKNQKTGAVFKRQNESYALFKNKIGHEKY